ncbi:hypothetical protein Tco_0299065 [Tanacetum coccineum]
MFQFSSVRFFNVVADRYVSPFTLFSFLPPISVREMDFSYVLSDGEFSLFPYQYFFRRSAGREFFKKPEHFSHLIVDLLALLEIGIFKSLHSFNEGLSRLLRHKLEGSLMVVKDEVLNDFSGFVGILIVEFAGGGAVNLKFKMKGDMIIKKLDLKPTINAMVRDFLEVLRSFSVERIKQGNK